MLVFRKARVIVQRLLLSSPSLLLVGLLFWPLMIVADQAQYFYVEVWVGHVFCPS